MVGGLLSARELLQQEPVVIPDLAIHEVANAIFIQEHVLHRIPGGNDYLELLFELIESGNLQVVKSSADLMGSAYEIAAKHHVALYDCVFVALALQFGVELRTIDERQRKVMELERAT